MAWPYTPLTTYVTGTVPAIKAYDLNKFQAFVNGFVTLHDQELFGNGSDGAVTISSGTTTLSRDMYYTTLVVNAGTTLKTNGYAIYANQSVTVYGTIDGSGANASAQTPGTAVGPHSCAGLYLAQGAPATQTPYPALLLGGNGNQGGNGTPNGGSCGYFADWASKNYLIAPFRLGQQTRGYTQNFAGTYQPQCADYWQGGAGGGAGGNDGTYLGGGGGAGGALIVIISPSITVSGTLYSAGGVGGTPTGGNCGGGAGGSGGAFLLVCRTNSITGSLSAPAGAGGSGHGTGSGGPFGNAGNATPYIVTLPSWPT